MRCRAVLVVTLATALAGWAGGCCSSPSAAPQASLASASSQPPDISPSKFVDAVRARCDPPAGWIAEPLKATEHHTHQLWISPTGRTAYGVIRFTLPLPVGHEPVLWFFLDEMRRSEGQVQLLTKQWDPNLRGLRFVARGGLYTVRTSLLVRGFQGWAVYAGTLTSEPIEPAELAMAERAREQTAVGR